jgi:hypothetical protein
MNKHPTSEQFESLDALFNTRNAHVANFVKMLEAELEQTMDMVIAPNADRNVMIHLSGQASCLKSILKLVKFK